MLIYLQNIANRFPNAFNYTANVTKSYVPIMNGPARIEVGKCPDMVANESTT